jgi:hypothetical protein
MSSPENDAANEDGFSGHELRISNPHIKTVEDLRISLLVKSVVADTVKEHSLSAEEQRWVRLAIKREARIEEFRNAVIEKTFTGIIWAFILTVGYALWEYFKIKLGTRS